MKLVKSFRGEDIGLARFEGVYLPLLWEPSFCTRSPIALGYTRGHFSALVPTESYSSRLEASSNDEEDVTFLPLMDSDMKLLPIHFINETEVRWRKRMRRIGRAIHNVEFFADGPRGVVDAPVAGRVHDRGGSDGGAAEAEPAAVAGGSNDRGVAQLLQEAGVSGDWGSDGTGVDIEDLC